MAAIHLSPSFENFLKAVIGMEWPQGDAGELKDSADAMHGLSVAFREAIALYQVYAKHLRDAMEGETADQLYEMYHNQVPSNLDQLATAAEQLSQANLQAAAGIQKTKILFVALLVMAAIMIADLAVSIIGAFLIPFVVAATRIGLANLVRELIARITEFSVKEVVLKLAGKVTVAGIVEGIGKAAPQVGKDVVKYGTIGAGIMGVLSVAVDKYQIDHEKTKGGLRLRDHVDLQGLFSSAVLGFVGGGLFGAGRAAARGIDIVSQDLRADLKSVVIAQLAPQTVKSLKEAGGDLNQLARLEPKAVDTALKDLASGVSDDAEKAALNQERKDLKNYVRATSSLKNLGYTGFQMAIGGAGANALINTIQDPVSALGATLFPEKNDYPQDNASPAMHIPSSPAWAGLLSMFSRAQGAAVRGVADLRLNFTKLDLGNVDVKGLDDIHVGSGKGDDFGKGGDAGRGGGSSGGSTAGSGRFSGSETSTLIGDSDTGQRHGFGGGQDSAGHGGPGSVGSRSQTVSGERNGRASEADSASGEGTGGSLPQRASGGVWQADSPYRAAWSDDVTVHQSVNPLGAGFTHSATGNENSFAHGGSDKMPGNGAASYSNGAQDPNGVAQGSRDAHQGSSGMDGSLTVRSGPSTSAGGNGQLSLSHFLGVRSASGTPVADSPSNGAAAHQGGSSSSPVRSQPGGPARPSTVADPAASESTDGPSSSAGSRPATVAQPDGQASAAGGKEAASSSAPAGTATPAPDPLRTTSRSNSWSTGSDPGSRLSTRDLTRFLGGLAPARDTEGAPVTNTDGGKAGLRGLLEGGLQVGEERHTPASADRHAPVVGEQEAPAAEDPHHNNDFPLLGLRGGGTFDDDTSSDSDSHSGYSDYSDNDSDVEGETGSGGASGLTHVPNAWLVPATPVPGSDGHRHGAELSHEPSHGTSDSDPISSWEATLAALATSYGQPTVAGAVDLDAAEGIIATALGVRPERLTGGPGDFARVVDSLTHNGMAALVRADPALDRGQPGQSFVVQRHEGIPVLINPSAPPEHTVIALTPDDIRRVGNEVPAFRVSVFDTGGTPAPLAAFGWSAVRGGTEAIALHTAFQTRHAAASPTLTDVEPVSFNGIHEVFDEVEKAGNKAAATVITTSPLEQEQVWTVVNREPYGVRLLRGRPGEIALLPSSSHDVLRFVSVRAVVTDRHGNVVAGQARHRPIPAGNTRGTTTSESTAAARPARNVADVVARANGADKALEFHWRRDNDRRPKPGQDQQLRPSGRDEHSGPGYYYVTTLPTPFTPRGEGLNGIADLALDVLFGERGRDDVYALAVTTSRRGDARDEMWILDRETIGDGRRATIKNAKTGQLMDWTALRNVGAVDAFVDDREAISGPGTRDGRTTGNLLSATQREAKDVHNEEFAKFQSGLPKFLDRYSRSQEVQQEFRRFLQAILERTPVDELSPAGTVDIRMAGRTETWTELFERANTIRQMGGLLDHILEDPRWASYLPRLPDTPIEVLSEKATMRPYQMLALARAVREQWEVPLDLSLLRLAALDHALGQLSFDIGPIMVGAELSDPKRGTDDADPALKYFATLRPSIFPVQDGGVIDPQDEKELRAHLGPLPDETFVATLDTALQTTENRLRATRRQRITDRFTLLCRKLDPLTRSESELEDALLRELSGLTDERIRSLADQDRELLRSTLSKAREDIPPPPDEDTRPGYFALVRAAQKAARSLSPETTALVREFSGLTDDQITSLTPAVATSLLEKLIDARLRSLPDQQWTRLLPALARARIRSLPRTEYDPSPPPEATRWGGGTGTGTDFLEHLWGAARDRQSLEWTAEKLTDMARQAEDLYRPEKFTQAFDTFAAHETRLAIPTRHHLAVIKVLAGALTSTPQTDLNSLLTTIADHLAQEDTTKAVNEIRQSAARNQAGKANTDTATAPLESAPEPDPPPRSVELAEVRWYRNPEKQEKFRSAARHAPPAPRPEGLFQIPGRPHLSTLGQPGLSDLPTTIDHLDEVTVFLDSFRGLSWRTTATTAHQLLRQKWPKFLGDTTVARAVQKLEAKLSDGDWGVLIVIPTEPHQAGDTEPDSVHDRSDEPDQPYALALLTDNLGPHAVGVRGHHVTWPRSLPGHGLIFAITGTPDGSARPLALDMPRPDPLRIELAHHFLVEFAQLHTKPGESRPKELPVVIPEEFPADAKGWDAIVDRAKAGADGTSGIIYAFDSEGISKLAIIFVQDGKPAILPSNFTYDNLIDLRAMVVGHDLAVLAGHEVATVASAEESGRETPAIRPRLLRTDELQDNEAVEGALARHHDPPSDLTHAGDGFGTLASILVRLLFDPGYPRAAVVAFERFPHSHPNSYWYRYIEVVDGALRIRGYNGSYPLDPAAFGFIGAVFVAPLLDDMHTRPFLEWAGADWHTNMPRTSRNPDGSALHEPRSKPWTPARLAARAEQSEERWMHRSPQRDIRGAWRFFRALPAAPHLYDLQVAADVEVLIANSLPLTRDVITELVDTISYDLAGQVRDIPPLRRIGNLAQALQRYAGYVPGTAASTADASLAQLATHDPEHFGSGPAGFRNLIERVRTGGPAGATRRHRARLWRVAEWVTTLRPTRRHAAASGARSEEQRNADRTRVVMILRYPRMVYRAGTLVNKQGTVYWSGPERYLHNDSGETVATPEGMAAHLGEGVAVFAVGTRSDGTFVAGIPRRTAAPRTPAP